MLSSKISERGRGKRSRRKHAGGIMAHSTRRTRNTCGKKPAISKRKQKQKIPPHWAYLGRTVPYENGISLLNMAVWRRLQHRVSEGVEALPALEEAIRIVRRLDGLQLRVRGPSEALLEHALGQRRVAQQVQRFTCGRWHLISSTQRAKNGSPDPPKWRHDRCWANGTPLRLVVPPSENPPDSGNSLRHLCAPPWRAIRVGSAPKAPGT